MRAKMGQYEFVRAFFAGCFSVPTQNAGLWKSLFDQIFKLLGAHAKLANLFAATGWACFGHLPCVAALVAQQSPARAMVCEGHIIPRATQNKATLTTKNVSAASFAVKEEDSLFSGVQTLR